MPKSQIVEPAKERQSGTIPFAEVPLNQYKHDLPKEIENYGADAILGIYEDMLLIREFESMLQSIKTQGSYEGDRVHAKVRLTFRLDRRHQRSVRPSYWA